MTGGVWIASYVLLWIAVVVLGLAVVVLLRQIGALHARLRSMGVHDGGEGPERGLPAPPVPGIEWSRSRVTLVAFTSPSCTICAGLLPGLRAVARQYDGVAVQVVDHGPSTLGVFSSFNVRSTPYLVAVDHDGVVQARGVANSLEQVEVMVDEVLAASGSGA